MSFPSSFGSTLFAVSVCCVPLPLMACGDSASIPTSPSANEHCFPTMWEPRPIDELPAGTRTATMSMKTDRDAVCRWGEIEGVSYVELPHAFERTGGTEHATPIAGLTDGSYYRWYAKCEVAATSCMTPHDLVFVFHVAAR